VKNGHNKGRQLYYCKCCGKQFLEKKQVDNQRLWQDYIFGKQTLKQLSCRYGISVSSVQRRLKDVRTTRIISADKQVVVQMDTTYWGRDFGVVVFKDAIGKKILWRKFVRHETLADYQEGVNWLEEQGYDIVGIVRDGLRGMFTMLGKYKVQMCQYHQVSIVRRYLTKEPELEASKELLSIVKLLAHTDKESFTGLFESWLHKWDNFLKERSKDKKTGKGYYVHKRLRSAYLSLQRNMSYLWTYYDYPDRGIPNTNNGLEGKFTDLKTKLRNHNGLSKEQRRKFIDLYFRNTFFCAVSPAGLTAQKKPS
jgi:hypothetical protein